MARQAFSTILAVAALGAVAACGIGPAPANPTNTAPASAAATDPGTQAPAPGTAMPTSEPAAEPDPPTLGPEPSTGVADPATDPIAGWSLERKVGQLFMVGISASKPQQLTFDLIRGNHVGSVFLSGRSKAGTKKIGALTASLRAAGEHQGAAMWISTDQEGGAVQVLSGPGFEDIPDAMAQAAWTPDQLRGKARTWGAELSGAGVNVNLAPVADLVPSRDFAPNNAPIGYFKRNYGFTTQSAATDANAFCAGMRESGVLPTIKHFPGLGRVVRSTDTATDVVDTVTTRDDPSVSVFQSGIDAGAPIVMVSLAMYQKIDPGVPAVFSPVIVRDMLRGSSGFTGVIITDDLSAAAQVQPWTPADRAILSIRAGVDILLVSASPTVAPPMIQAVLNEARLDPAFAAMVDDAARRVVQAKAAHH